MLREFVIINGGSLWVAAWSCTPSLGDRNPIPPITFRVNVIDYPELLANITPGTLESTLLQLQNAVVWIEYVGRPLKQGDTFTLYGQQALTVKIIISARLLKL